jgi:hypothetical protein
MNVTAFTEKFITFLFLSTTSHLVWYCYFILTCYWSICFNRYSSHKFHRIHLLSIWTDIGCSTRRLIGHSLTRVIKTQNIIEASITLGGWSSNEYLQFAGRYQCLPIRYSGRLISPKNEHPV